jgi:hypothetical protein
MGGRLHPVPEPHQEVSMCSKSLSLCLAIAGALLAAGNPAAGVDVRFATLDLHGGTNEPSNWDGGSTFGLSANLVELERGLWLAPALFYSSMGRDLEAFQTVEIDRTTLALGAELRWYPSRQAAGLYLGAGAFLTRVDESTSVSMGPIETTLETSGEHLGAMGVAGFRFGGASSTALFVEARYALVPGGDTFHFLGGLSFGR